VLPCETLKVPRRLQRDEWKLLRDLRLRALREAPEAFAQSAERAQMLTEADWRARLAASGESAWFVEELDGSAVGMAAGFINETETSLAHLGGMFVEPIYRRSGIGRALIEAVEQWAAAQAVDRVVLEVNPAMTAARRLYENAGYHPTGNEDLIHGRITVIEMSKQLT
jgi:GNAT superfamily N-acetyltransferase